MSATKKTRRCPNGTRRNKKTGECEPITMIPTINAPTEPVEVDVSVPDAVPKKRCPAGTRRNKKTGLCEPIPSTKIVIGENLPDIPLIEEPRMSPRVVSTVVAEKAPFLEEEEGDVANNKDLFMKEKREHDEEMTNEYDFLYPTLNDPQFNVKIAERKEFYDTKYDGDIATGIKQKANQMCNAKFELMPHQLFVKNFMSFQTPYNGLLLYHGLGSGKTCSAIGIAEEMRGYMKQVGIKHRIIVVASPNVQGNFRMQLFDERKLKKIPNPNQTQGLMGTEEDIWDIHSCVGNSLLKEINPANVKGLSREKVISQINNIINTYYTFMGYGQLSNYINEKISISSPERFTEKERLDYEIRNIRRVFNNRLMIIDEVHNIRLSDENNNKKTASLLMKVAKYSENMRLLLLSATPMFNSHKEILWITNLLNMNDKRSTIEVNSVFDKDGNYREGDKKGMIEDGESLLKRKLTGYVSYVRGENPFIFPYRIYPNLFSPEHTFSETRRYPKYQMNGMEIQEPIKYVRVYLNHCGTYQESVYNSIINSMRRRDYTYQTSMGNIRELPSFENMESFGYTLLQTPIEALNMVYPNPDIEKMFEGEREKEAEADADSHLRTITKTVGNEGLSNIMDFDDDTKPNLIKHNFRYKSKVESKYGRIFRPEYIREYSAKIANICDIIKKSNGIVVVYSQYIHGGIIPLALALEEMGFSRYSSNPSYNKNLFKKQKQPAPRLDARQMIPQNEMEDETLFSPAKYMMITGDKSYSPSNTEDIKYATHPSNKNGENVKVILVSKAGSEGLDFKNVRQVHIMEPWYNMNRIEQIIGRGVRNLSHCDLPFEQRNVEIYMHSTLLTTNPEEEAVDLYVYRFAEKKAIQIGRVSRTLKESSVDCILNISQTNFTADKLGEILENQRIEMNLSSGKTVQFRVGDEPYSSMCDYMESCEYVCSPNKTTGLGENKSTYNEYYSRTNHEYIIKRISELYREKSFYKRDGLIREINRLRVYPLEQIFQALTFLVKNKNEYLVDKYGRIGNLLNKGEYYVFQPVEISDPDISIYERTVPVAYKRRDFTLEVPTTFVPQKQDIHTTVDVLSEKPHEVLLSKMIMNYNTVFSQTRLVLASGEKNWYKHANQVILNIEIEYGIPKERLQEYVIYHMLDLMMFEDKMTLLEYLYGNTDADADVFSGKDATETLILEKCKKYFDKKMLQKNGQRVIFLTKDNVSKLYANTNSGKWEEVDIEDYKQYEELIARNIVPSQKVNSTIIGFVNMFKNKEMVFKIKDVRQKRNNVGARCGDSTTKSDVIKALNALLGMEVKYDTTFHIGLCVLIEILLRWYTEIEKDGKTYFFDAEQTNVNNIVKSGSKGS